MVLSRTYYLLSIICTAENHTYYLLSIICTAENHTYYLLSIICTAENHAEWANPETLVCMHPPKLGSLQNAFQNFPSIDFLGNSS